MAIRLFTEEGPHIDPLCAIKVGSFNCFCVWTPGGSQAESQSETCLRDEERPRLADTTDFKKSLQVDESTDAGSDATATTAGATAEASSTESQMAAQAALTLALAEHPLLANIRLNLGQRSPAMRDLIKAVSAGGDVRNLDMTIFEQVKRSACQHEAALNPLINAPPNEWPVLQEAEGSELGLSYGARVVEGVMQWFRSMDFPDCDIVKGFASHLEADLSSCFCDNLAYAEPLGMHVAKRDAVWRTVIQSPDEKQDNIWLYSPIDALEEPISSLLIISYTTPRPPGLLTVPPAQAGHTRSEFECIITRLQPLRSRGGSRSSGFRLTQVGVSRPIGGRSALVTSKPIGEDFARKTKLLLTKLKQCIERTGRLDQRMGMSPRTELYDRLRRHLANLPSHRSLDSVA